MASLSRRERIEFLLDHWPDYTETLHAVDRDGPGDSDAVTGMPRMYRHPSVVELRRVLELYSRLAPTRYWHLKAFYQAEWRNVTRPVKRRTKKGKSETVMVRERARILPREVRLVKVRSGVDFVVGAFRGEPFVPDELLEDKAA